MKLLFICIVLYGCELAWNYKLTKGSHVKREGFIEKYKSKVDNLEITSYLRFVHFDFHLHFKIKNLKENAVNYIKEVELLNKLREPIGNFEVYRDENYDYQNLFKSDSIIIKKDSTMELFYLYKNITDRFKMGSSFPFIKNMESKMKSLIFTFKKIVIKRKIDEINLSYTVNE
jgi:hypothetical protein